MAFDSPDFSIIGTIFSGMSCVPNRYPSRSCPLTAGMITDFHNRKLFWSSFTGQLKLITLPNKELLSIVMDWEKSVLDINGVESVVVTDEDEVESAMV